MTNTIESLADLQAYVRSGWTDWKQFGEVETKTKDDYILFNYSIGAVLLHRWNFFERISRGLILHRKTGEIVARPFDKFFNWGESGLYAPALPENIRVKRVTEKVDGSIGIFYRLPNGEYSISTRGSFESDQAKWATRYLHEQYSLRFVSIPDACTLLFEIIFPENRIVIDYGNAEMLVLLAARNRHTGEYYASDFVEEVAKKCGFSLPRVYRENEVGDTPLAIQKTVEKWERDREGVVLEFIDGSRWKIKGDAYVEVSRLLTHLAPRRIVQAVRDGTIDDILPLLPPHIQRGVQGVMEEIYTIYHQTEERAKQLFALAPVTTSRKEFATWVMQNHRASSHYLFRLYDGQSLDSDIFKHEFNTFKGRLVLPETLDLD